MSWSLTDAALNCGTDFMSIFFCQYLVANSLFLKLAFSIKTRDFTHLFGKSASLRYLGIIGILYDYTNNSHFSEKSYFLLALYQKCEFLGLSVTLKLIVKLIVKLMFYMSKLPKLASEEKYVSTRHTMTTTKFMHSFFFEPREELYTGEETPLDLLLNGIPLNSDIQNHINGFIGEELVHHHLFDVEDSYIFYHDELSNKHAFLIDAYERHCFETEIEGDFVVDDEILRDF